MGTVLVEQLWRDFDSVRPEIVGNGYPKFGWGGLDDAAIIWGQTLNKCFVQDVFV